MQPRAEKLSYPVEVLLRQDETFKRLFYISKVLMFTNSKFYQEIKFDKNNDGALCAAITMNPSATLLISQHHSYITEKLNRFGISSLRENKSNYIKITDAKRRFNDDEISFAKFIIKTIVGKKDVRNRVFKDDPITVSPANSGKLDSTFAHSERLLETTSNNGIVGDDKVHVDISGHEKLSKIIFHFEKGNLAAMLYPKDQYTGAWITNYRHRSLIKAFHFILSKGRDKQGELVYLLDVEEDSKSEYNAYRKDFISKVLSAFECNGKYKLVTEQEQADVINSNQVPFDMPMLYPHFSAFYPAINAKPFPSTPPRNNDINNNNTTLTCATKRSIHAVETDTALNEQGVSKYARHQQSTEYPIYANPATFHSQQADANTIPQQEDNHNLLTKNTLISEGEQKSSTADDEDEQLFDYLARLSP